MFLYKIINNSLEFIIKKFVYLVANVLYSIYNLNYDDAARIQREELQYCKSCKFLLISLKDLRKKLCPECRAYVRKANRFGRIDNATRYIKIQYNSRDSPDYIKQYMSDRYPSYDVSIETRIKKEISQKEYLLLSKIRPRSSKGVLVKSAYKL